MADSPTAEQIYSALVALGCPPVLSPTDRPNGPLEEDRAQLLGVLLAAVERATIEEGPETSEEFDRGYLGQMHAHQDGGMGMMGCLGIRMSRMSRLLRGVGGGPFVQAGAKAAQVSADMLSLYALARMGVDSGERRTAIRDLVRSSRTDMRDARQLLEDSRRTLVKAGMDV